MNLPVVVILLVWEGRGRGGGVDGEGWGEERRGQGREEGRGGWIDLELGVVHFGGFVGYSVRTYNVSLGKLLSSQF